MSYLIYRHTCKKNHLVYIGITRQDPPEKRWQCGNAYKDNHLIYSDILKYGWKKGFLHEVIVTDIPTFEEARVIEQKIITEYLRNPEYLASIKRCNHLGIKIYNRNIKNR